MLIKKGLSSYTGSVKLKMLNEKFLDDYSLAFLSLIGLKEIEGNFNWFRRTLGDKSSNFSQHLLAWHFLKTLPEDLYDRDRPRNFFEPGPWLCLNPACKLYLEAVIKNVQEKVDERGQLFGIFSCSCGFTYSRRGPDISS